MHKVAIPSIREEGTSRSVETWPELVGKWGHFEDDFGHRLLGDSEFRELRLQGFYGLVRTLAVGWLNTDEQPNPLSPLEGADKRGEKSLPSPALPVWDAEQQMRRLMLNPQGWRSWVKRAARNGTPKTWTPASASALPAPC